MSMRPDEEGHVEYKGVTVLVETLNSVKIQVPWRGGDHVVWLPKSHIHENSEVYRMGTSGRLVIPLWLAEAKRLPT